MTRQSQPVSDRYVTYPYSLLPVPQIIRMYLEADFTWLETFVFEHVKFSVEPGREQTSSFSEVKFNRYLHIAGSGGADHLSEVRIFDHAFYRLRPIELRVIENVERLHANVE